MGYCFIEFGNRLVDHALLCRLRSDVCAVRACIIGDHDLLDAATVILADPVDPCVDVFARPDVVDRNLCALGVADDRDRLSALL